MVAFGAVTILLMFALLQPGSLCRIYPLMRRAQTGFWPNLLCCPASFPWVVVVRQFRPLIQIRKRYIYALAGTLAWQGLFTNQVSRSSTKSDFWHTVLR